jgi:hypothetical protein
VCGRCLPRERYLSMRKTPGAEVLHTLREQGSARNVTIPFREHGNVAARKEDMTIQTDIARPPNEQN